MQVDIERLVSVISEKVKENLNVNEQPQQTNIKTADIAKALEHSMLQTGATEEDILKGCKDAKEHNLGAVVVPVWYVTEAVKALKGTGVKVVCAIAFPNGSMSTACKLKEVRDALEAGADEIDVVPHFDMIKRGCYEDVQDELKEIIQYAKGRMLVKINIEWHLFDNEEKNRLINMAIKLGADFVKIQHFLAGGKASIEEVIFIRKMAGDTLGIKIDGGIKTADFCRELMQAGASRMGLTASVAVVAGDK